MERLLRDRRICEFLERIDEDRAEQVKRSGCDYCGGRLHRADYDRKPRGGPVEVMERWDRRWSFCCEREGCRKRHTPPSVRFLGRKVYVGMVVVVVSAMMHGARARGAGELEGALGIDVRTLKRWRRWWVEVFARGPFWKVERARFLPPLEERALPLGLLEAFGAPLGEGLVKLLEFLCPITTCTAQGSRAM